MATTTIHLIPQPGVKRPVLEMSAESSKIDLEPYGAVLKDSPLPGGMTGDRIIPWHRITEVHRKPE